MSTHTMQVDVAGVTKLLATSLYSDPDVFLRELIQNGHDAIVKRRLSSVAENGDASEPRIRIVVDETAGTLSVEDNGSGLTQSDIHSYVATIGASDKPALRRQIGSRNLAGTTELIGQFGIGLLSAFIVADKIEIVTRPKKERGWKWMCTGSQDYTLTEADRETVGTTVILYLNAQQRRYLQYDRLREIIKKYSDFIGMPIYLGESTQAVNAVQAPWQRTYANTQERDIAHRAYWATRFREEVPLAVFALDETFDLIDPVTGQATIGHVRGILGITDRHLPGIDTRGSIDIYINRVFVAAANREVIPAWASFMQGVLECGQLTPNAARDNVVANSVLFALRQYLGLYVVKCIRDLAANDVARFMDIMSWHQFQILGMCVQEEHEDFFRAVADIVPLESDQGRVSVREYIKSTTALPDGRKVVYYITEASSESQFYMLCQARGLRVFNAAGNFTRTFLERYQRLWPERIHLKRIDVSTSDIIFGSVTSEERKQFEQLQVLASSLKCVPRITRFVPKEVPALLSTSRDSNTREEMEILANTATVPAYIRSAIKEFLGENKEPLTLNLNADNPIVRLLAQRLSTQSNDKLGQMSLVSLFNNAIMLNSRNITPANIQIMFSQYTQLVGELLDTADSKDQIEKARRSLEIQLQETRGAGEAKSGLDRMVTCFVAMPFNRPEFDAVYTALEDILEDIPFLWNVIRADERVTDPRLWKNVDRLMATAHCFIAEASEHNPNVMIEIGRMEAFQRPLLIIKREGAPDLPADLKERLFAHYSGTGEDLVESLRNAISKQEIFCRQSGEPYLSKKFLQRTGLGESTCNLIAGRYRSCLDFANANAEEVSRSLSIKKNFVQGAQDAVNEAIKLLSTERK
jgi:molecular chaperone HtpG